MERQVPAGASFAFDVRLIGLSLFSLLVGVLTMGAYLGHTILTN